MSSLTSSVSQGHKPYSVDIDSLADYNEPMPARCMSPNESNRPTYTSESASNILLQFGLEKEDLEQLICYPENQVTPENLPFILRQIRMNKDKRTSTVDKPKPYSEPQPITTMSSVTTFSSVRSSMAPSSSGPAKKMEAQPSQTSQSAFASFSVPNKDTNLRHLGAGVPKSLPLKQPEPDRQSSAKHQPSSNLSHGVHPNRPGLILIGSNEQSQNSNRNKIEVQISKVSERVKKPAQQGQQPFQPRDTSTLKPIPAPAQLITSCATSVPGPPSKKQLAAKMGNPKHVPGATMIQEEAKVSPSTPADV
uniref:Uncharacterized protein n=1 Tax=Nothobranchius kadleci TaxID=1051664 RepID=A0A1A8BHF1_NOTKA